MMKSEKNRVLTVHY